MNKKGVTLIELITTISIVAILAAATTGIIIYLMQLFVYTPREMKARSVAHEVAEAMVEGSAPGWGMRYAVKVLLASPTQFTYTIGYPANTDKRNVYFRWDNATGRIFRSISAPGSNLSTPPVLPAAGAEEQIPYYAGSEIFITGRAATPTAIFTYFDASGSQMAATVPSGQLDNIKRVEININVTTGTGQFQDWEGSFGTTTSVEIKQYI